MKRLSRLVEPRLTRSTIYDALTSPAGVPSPPSSPDLPLQPKLEPGSSQPQPLALPPTRVKTEAKPHIAASPSSSTFPNHAAARETDEQMARRLQSQYDDEPSSSSTPRATRTAAATPAKKKKKTNKVTKKRVSRASVGSDDDEDGGPKKKKRAAPDNNFNKELILSDALSGLVGAARLSRPQVVKQIWAYVKERDLQDASDKRYILCDEKLKRVFHTDRLHMFTMNKILVDHVRNPDEVIVKDEAKPTVAAAPSIGNVKPELSAGSVQPTTTGGLVNGGGAGQPQVISDSEDEFETDDED
ncbi:hypothetical protein I317_00561 [Kwoniella heveanensis CBS 569]|nr:hypothetical protein I317_00561 [Kwoniella heveanensis CBS 569]